MSRIQVAFRDSTQAIQHTNFIQVLYYQYPYSVHVLFTPSDFIPWTSKPPSRDWRSILPFLIVESTMEPCYDRLVLWLILDRQVSVANQEVNDR